MEDSMKLYGELNILLRGKDGKVKIDRTIKNTVTTLAKTHVADQIAATPGETAMGYMAVGTGTGGTTALTTEVDRNALTSRTHTNAIVTYVGDWAAGDGTGAITEAGIFNDASAGTMLVYSSFSAVNKAAGDTLKITWTLTIN